MLRVASFNVENLDEKSSNYNPSLAERAPVLRFTLNRLKAEILCLQEVHAQELPEHTASNPKRHLSALEYVLQGTTYEGNNYVHTLTTDGEAYDVRNLVIVSAFPIVEFKQYRNDLIDHLQYKKLMAIDPPDMAAKALRWERPILHARIKHPVLGLLHIINIHLKSKLATNVPGQKYGYNVWMSAAGWAEGFFLSSIKRVGQALETRVLIDKIFDEDADAKILVCGDFNTEPGEVPVEAICGKVENTNNPKLRSRVLIPCSAGIPDSVKYSHIHHGRGNLLDHVLISNAMLPYFDNAEILNENLHDESLPYNNDSKYPESDHAAFLAKFDV